MSPADKAPWIWRIRHEQDLVDVRHRDPVRLDAAPTLTAYIEWLESHFGGGL